MKLHRLFPLLLGLAACGAETESPTPALPRAERPLGEAQAAAVPPPEFNPFGLNVHSVPLEDMQWARIQWLGVGWVRIDATWWEVNREKGVLRWGRTDGTVIEALERGLDVVLLLSGTPPWVMGIDQVGGWTASSVPPVEPWEEFVRAAALRYRPGGELARQRGWPPGRGVHVWEVWNEPDLPVFWSGTASEYRDRIWLPAVRVLRREAPEGRIALGGLCCFEGPGSDSWPQGGSTAEVLSTQESRDGLDIFSLHYYPRSAERTTLLDPYREMELWLRSAQAFLDGIYGNRRVIPLWLTETGFSRALFGEEQQSAGIQREIGRILMSPTNRLLKPETGTHLLEKFFLFNSISQDFGILELHPAYRVNAAGLAYRLAMGRAFELLPPGR